MGEIYNRQIEQKRKLHGFKGVWIPVEFLEFADGSLSFIEIHILAEIKNLCENGVYGNCVMSNESFSKFIGCSTKTVERAIKHLSDLHAISVKIEHTDRRGKTRYIFYNSDLFKRKTTSVEYIDKMSDDQQTLSLLNMSDQQTLSPDQQTLSPEKSASNSDCDCDSSTSNNNKNNNNNNNNNKGTGAGATSKRHSQIYKERKKLKNELDSEGYIAEQKQKEKLSKKESDKEECLSIIRNRYSAEIQPLLEKYYLFISDKKQAIGENKNKVISSPDKWKKKLDNLDKLVKDGYDPLAIIQQSLDKKAYVFFELQSEHKQFKQAHECYSDKIITNTMTEEEMRAALRENMKRGIKG